MPIDIALHLRNIKAGDVPDNLRKKIIEWVSFHLSSQTMYPNKLYNVAAVTLVNTYPQLRDSSDSGHTSWYMCLRNKYKNMRKRMPPGCPEVDAQKSKWKARKLGESPVASKTAFRRQTIVKSTFETDPIFVTEATNFIIKELKKQSPNMEKVEDAMLKTTVARRKSIELEGMSLTDLGQPLSSTNSRKGDAKGVGAIMVLPFLVNERGGDIFTEMSVILTFSVMKAALADSFDWVRATGTCGCGGGFGAAAA
ncbi:hypothetical protein MTO96_052148 [Rhipicephalus appendiculatus]